MFPHRSSNGARMSGAGKGPSGGSQFFSPALEQLTRSRVWRSSQQMLIKLRERLRLWRQPGELERLRSMLGPPPTLVQVLGEQREHLQASEHPEPGLNLDPDPEQ